MIKQHNKHYLSIIAIWFVEQSKVKLKSSQREEDDKESSESGYDGNSSIKNISNLLTRLSLSSS
jgi:hypothetical protein